MEIARAVLHKAKVIIFDEPTASLTPEEKKYFFDLIFNLKARGGAVDPTRSENMTVTCWRSAVSCGFGSDFTGCGGD